MWGLGLKFEGAESTDEGIRYTRLPKIRDPLLWGPDNKDNSFGV